ncbi:MAG TPA: hypothetical protein VFH51_02950, partial [Myxococcota bacterium]|nr:hypothetical protein [Myxococcota bacterium]
CVRRRLKGLKTPVQIVTPAMCLSPEAPSPLDGAPPVKAPASEPTPPTSPVDARCVPPTQAALEPPAARAGWPLLRDSAPEATRERVLNLRSRWGDFLLEAREGLLCAADGRPFDTAGQEAKFVLCPERGLLGAVKFKEDGLSLHHSSFTSGDVNAAGLAVVAAGRVVYLICDSGHYNPTPVTMARFLAYLADRGIPLEGIRVGFHGRDPDAFVWLRAEDVRRLGDDVDLEQLAVPGPNRAGKKTKQALSRSSTKVFSAEHRGAAPL